MHSKSFIDYFKNFSLFVFCAALLAGNVSSVFGQSTFANGDDRTLVAGNPPLRQSDINKSISVFEFFFDAKFDEQSRRAYQTSIENEWRRGDRATIKSMADIVALHGKMREMNYMDKYSMREAALPQILADLRATPEDPTHRILLGVYESAHGDSSRVAAKKRVEILKETGSLDDLVGKWETKSSGSGEVNSSGRVLGMSGSFFSLTFHEDGRVEYVALVNSQFGGCLTSAYKSKAGRASVSGEELAINYPNVSIDYKGGCSGRDYTKKLPAETVNYTWSIIRDEYDTIRLCLREPDGSTVCYRKAV